MAPKGPPRPPAKNAKAGTLGVKRLLLQPRPPKERPEGMTDVEWAADQLRRDASSSERRFCRERSLARTAAATLETLVCATATATGGKSPGGASSSSTSASPFRVDAASTPRSQSRLGPSQGLSPNFNEPGGYAGYAFGYGNFGGGNLGGFDPKQLHSFGGTPTGAEMGLDLNEAYESPGLRRGGAAVGLAQSRRTLMFEDGAHNLFDTGPQASFGTQAPSGGYDFGTQASFGTQDGGGSAVVDEERDVDNAGDEFHGYTPDPGFLGSNEVVNVD
ncbi:hypothetical protein D1007_50622 [Hordeum vulgare]|nr:hypothetical protein D1007_50622 [Hordeum vulgare]